MTGTTSRPVRAAVPVPPVSSDTFLADEEAVEEAIGEAFVSGDDGEFEDGILLRPVEPHEGLDWFTPEALEELQEGIGPPLEEALHDVDLLHEAILDEGYTLESFDGDAVEAEVEEDEQERDEAGWR